MVNLKAAIVKLGLDQMCYLSELLELLQDIFIIHYLKAHEQQRQILLIMIDMMISIEIITLKSNNLMILLLVLRS